MKKYKVVVPPPSAKRMAGNGKVTIHFDESFGSGSHSIQRQFNQDVECLELGLVEVEFDVPDSYEWLGATSFYDLSLVAKLAVDFCDVVTTSGDQTGQPPTIEKIKTIKEAIGDKPLAIASGITSENVKDFKQYTEYFLV